MTEEKKVDRFYVERKDSDEFNRLKEKDSPFARAHNKDIFLAAMVVGYHEGRKVQIKSREGYFHETDLLPTEQALIRAIAVSEEGALSVLLDKQKVYSIAEQYAAGGIALLKAKVFSGEYGSYAKKLEGELLRAYEKALEKQPEKAQTLEEAKSIPAVDLIKNGESDSVEFKGSLIWDYKNNRPNKLMGMVVARTISSFMNSNGGLLLIGVDNDKNILGLEKDLAQLDGSADKFELHITNVINNHLGKIKGTLVAVRFENIEGKQIAVLTVKKSPRPVYLKYEGKLDFFIKSGNSCQLLDVREATEYIKDHWPDLP